MAIASNSASKFSEGGERERTKQHLSEMPATQKGVASTKTGKDCSFPPRLHEKTKFTEFKILNKD